MNRKTEQLLKVDTAGRVWTPRGQREAALDEFERSGMPVSKFADRIGVKYSTFASQFATRTSAAVTYAPRTPKVPWYLDPDSGGPNPLVKKDGVQYEESADEDS